MHIEAVRAKGRILKDKTVPDVSNVSPVYLTGDTLLQGAFLFEWGNGIFLTIYIFCIII